jgi:hypothetical protein
MILQGDQRAEGLLKSVIGRRNRVSVLRMESTQRLKTALRRLEIAATDTPSLPAQANRQPTQVGFGLL